MNMQYKFREIITNNGKIVSEKEFTCESETEMENEIALLRVEFNKARLRATIKGQGISFLNREQEFKIL